MRFPKEAHHTLTMKLNTYSNTLSILSFLTLLLLGALILLVPDIILAHGGEEEAVPDTVLRGMSPIKAFGGAALLIALFGFILFKVFRKK